MTLSQVVSESYLVYRGKLSSVPAVGSEKYNRIVSIANRKQREWVQDSNVDWLSRYEMRVLGTLTTGNQEYDLDNDIMRLSDYVIITDLQGNKRYIQTLRPQVISRYKSGCYISGGNPQQLNFVTPIDSSFNGFALTVPCFTIPADMTTPTSVVSVEDPNWLIYATAAELARNDYAKEEQYPNIIGQANDLYKNMVADAQANGFLQINSVTNNMPQRQDFYGGANRTPFGYN